MEEKADIDNCTNTSQVFGHLIQEERERKIVLPTVFAILSKRYYDENNKDESYKETNHESIPWQRPANCEWPLRMTGIWKCRLVCKKQNEAIEKINRNEDAGHYLMKDDFTKAENELK